MVNFTNRVPTYPNKKKITFDDGTIKYATVEYADEPTTVGTPINRLTLMKVQGMENSNTVFNVDGSITETYDDGNVKTVFNSDGSITETFTATDGKVIIKTTTFNEDGSIGEVIS